MDATIHTGQTLIPPAARIPPSDWRRIAIRQPKRKDLIAVRRLIERAAVDENSSSTLLDHVAAATAPVILRFLQGCPDLIYVALIDDAAGFHVRCSRDLTAVRRLVLAALDRKRARLAGDPEPDNESPRIALRRERVFHAMGQLIESLTTRRDLDLVLPWVVAGSSGVNLDSSDRMLPDDAHGRLEWFAHQVLELPVERSTASAVKSKVRA